MSNDQTPSASKRWTVVLVADSGAVTLPGNRLELNNLPTDEGSPVDVRIWTRHEDIGLGEQVPRELVIEVDVSAPDIDDAIALAGGVATGLATIASFSVNAFIVPPVPFLAFDSTPNTAPRAFWQRYLSTAGGPIRPTRLLREELLYPLLEQVFTAPESSRVTRAVSQYHVALRYWSTGGFPLALAHLYMALEALGPAVERTERKRLNLETAKDHAIHRGVDVARNNWKEVLLGWVRRDVVCQGDKDMYDAARAASDGFEHGSMPMHLYRAGVEEPARALMGYVRQGVLNLLTLEDEVRTGLLEKWPIDVSDLWIEVRGEIEGDEVRSGQFAQAGAAWPYLDFDVSVSKLHRASDGSLEVSHDLKLSPQLADNVRIRFTRYGIGLGATQRPGEAGAGEPDNGL